MALQFKSIHLQLNGVTLDPRSAPMQHASEFSRLSLNARGGGVSQHPLMFSVNNFRQNEYFEAKFQLLLHY